jgi:hypothetical protein
VRGTYGEGPAETDASCCGDANSSISSKQNMNAGGGGLSVMSISIRDGYVLGEPFICWQRMAAQQPVHPADVGHLAFEKTKSLMKKINTTEFGFVFRHVPTALIGVQ